MAYDGSLNFNTKVDTDGFNKGTRSMSSSLGSLKSSILKVGAAIGVAFGVNAIINFSKEAKAAYDLQIEAETKLMTIMRQRMNASNEEIDSIKQLASEQQKLGIIGDEVQLSGAQQVATFLNESKSIETLLPAMNNLLAQQKGVNATSQDAVNIGNMFGKVLQGQTSALKRVGITFTESEEKVLKYGNEQERSAMLAKVITNNVGEMNSVLAQTDAGKQKQLSNTLGDIKEQFGSAVSQIGILFLPALQALANGLSVVAEFAKEAAKSIAEFFGYDTSSSDVVNNIAAGTSQIAENAEDTAESNKEANKENKKNLASFDKINKLDKSTSNASSGSAGSSGITTSIKTENEPKTNKYSTYAKEIKKIFSDLKPWIDKNFKLDFSQIAENFKSVFGSMKDIAMNTFPGIKSMAGSAMSAISTYWTGIATAFTKQINTISLGLSKYFEQNKTKIINGINSITANLTSAFTNLQNFYSTVFSGLGASIDRMREPVSNAIANLLGGLTNMALSIGTIVSDAFNVFTKNLATWAEENKKKIGDFFDSFQQLGADLMNLFGDVFNDIGNTLSDWWKNEMKPVWDNVSKMFIGIGDTLMNLWLEWIYPIIQYVIQWAQKMWNEHLSGLFSKLLSFIAKVSDFISSLWNTWLKPIVDWLIKTLKPIIMGVVGTIGDVFETVFGAISDVIGGIIETFGGLLDFITGIFTGNWKKAWNGIKSFFKGIWDAIWGIVKFVVNLIIDGINLLWKGIYFVVKGIVDTIGGVAGAIGDLFGQDWHFSMPEEPPLIPKLATGTVVPANYGNFLAMLGDNKREPEVVSPLSTMKQAFKEALSESGYGGNQPIVIETNGDLDGLVSLLNFQIKKQERLAGATI